MFDRKLIEGFATDLDLNDVLAAACKGAADLMTRAADAERHSYISRRPNGTVAYFQETSESKAIRMMARAIMTPYRASFEARSEIESAMAASMVRVGAVNFLSPACAGETCLDCERPLWHHIVKWGTVTMCPFGREFWSYARALTTEGHEYRHGEGYELLCKIAAR